MDEKLNQLSVSVSLPRRLQGRPVAKNGFIVPWFVTLRKLDGEPDFRVIDGKRTVQAINGEKCWVCGERLGANRTFAIGPMCVINRVTAEPPMHRECAEYSVKVCPFMFNPRTKRNKADLPEGEMSTAGIMLDRNPGVTCLWHTGTRPASYRLVSSNGILFRLHGDPHEVEFYARGKPATYGEIMDSVNSGLPSLIELAKQDGRRAEEALAAKVDDAHRRFFNVPVPTI